MAKKLASATQSVVTDLVGHKLNDFEIAFMRQSLSEDIYQQLVAPYLIEDRDEARIQLRAMETAGQNTKNCSKVSNMPHKK